jgi:Na+/proline symporter
MTPLLFAVLAYVAVQLAIGFVVSRRIRTEDDYLVAGRRMGPLLATGTLFATWFGAETCMGAAGQAYSEGISLATAEPFAYGACIVFMGLVFAGILWRLELTTLADFFRTRYSPGVERLAACLMIPTSLFWAAAQVRAFGQVLSAISELELELAIAFATALVIVYTSCGGLLADAITDLIQGVCLMIGLAAMLFGVVAGMGGLEAAARALHPEQFRLLPSASSSTLELLEAWSVPILGSVVAQELVVRVSASRSAKVARGAALAGGSLYVLIGLVPLALGLIGAQLAPGLENPEEILTTLGATYLSPLLQALFAGALVSAILSTVDSTLLACASLASHNLVLPLLGEASEQRKVRLARGGVILFGLAAFALATRAEGVYYLVHHTRRRPSAAPDCS